MISRVNFDPKAPKTHSRRLFSMAGELGFEPRFSESESDVLPLNYSPAGAGAGPISSGRGGAYRPLHMGQNVRIDKSGGGNSGAHPPDHRRHGDQAERGHREKP